MYLLRYLHPDIVIIHHNVNDILRDSKVYRQSVLYYPQISNWDRTLLRNSRLYKLLKFTYFLSYNPIHYGKEIVYDDDKLKLPMQARISFYLNQNSPTADPTVFFREDFIGERQQQDEMSLEFLLTENYETLIKYTRADNSTLILTTQYLNFSKDVFFNDESR